MHGHAAYRMDIQLVLLPYEPHGTRFTAPPTVPADDAADRLRSLWPDSHRQAGDAALELLELGDVDEHRDVAPIGEQLRAARRVLGHQQPVATEQDDVPARLLRHVQELRERS